MCSNVDGRPVPDASGGRGYDFLEVMKMVIREFGKEHERTLLFFPGSCEPWQGFAPAAKLLAQELHVILVTPDGHDPENRTDFISVEKTVDDTSVWLRKHGVSHLDALYGLSFGGGMAVRFLTTQNILVDKAIIDAGTAPYQYPKWICRLIGARDFLMLKTAIASLSVIKAAFPPERFARNPENWKQEYRELQAFLKSFSNRTIWNIFWSANNYKVPNVAPEMDTVIQFWVGTDEWGSRFRDLKWYRKYLPQMEVVKIPNMMHGELVAMHPVTFAQKAIAFFKQGEMPCSDKKEG